MIFRMFKNPVLLVILFFLLKTAYEQKYIISLLLLIALLTLSRQWYKDLKEMDSWTLVKRDKRNEIKERLNLKKEWPYNRIHIIKYAEKKQDKCIIFNNGAASWQMSYLDWKMEFKTIKERDEYFDLVTNND